MNLWTICYPGEGGETIYETLSESEIVEQYWHYWYGKMCDKFGKEHVDANYTVQDCIDDWTILHWAWKSD